MAIKAGIVIVNKYCKPDSKIYSGYIRYMDREKAVRTEHVAEFDMFNEYMGNPEKTTGLFMNDKRTMTKDEIQEVKKLFEMAQDNGSFMWQTVISFDNLWLEKNGLYDSASKSLNEDKIKELTMNGVNRMLQNESLDHAVWTAAIHYNTDNIHVHIATVEVEPMREKRVYQQYAYKENEKGRLVKDGIIVDLNGNPVLKEEMKGKFSTKSFEICKQYMVNEILKEADLNKEINEIIRNRLVRSVKNNEVLKDPEFAKKLYDLYCKLPDCPKNMWNYGNNIMIPVRKDLDAVSDYYLQNYQKEDYEKLKDLLDKQNSRYKLAYGAAYSQRDYKESKLEDLHKRMGNSILKVLKEYDSEQLNVKDELKFDDNISDQLEIKNDIEAFVQDVYIESDNLADAAEYIENNIPEDVVEQADVKQEKYYIDWGKEYKTEKEKMQQYFLHKDGKDLESAQKAYSELKKIAKIGNVLAIYDLGGFTKNEHFGEVDEQKSNLYFKEAYEGFLNVLEKTKSAMSQSENEKAFEKERFKYDYLNFRLGQMNHYGRGVEQDYAQAAEYYKESSNSYAKYALGELYYNGYGVEQSYEKAVACYEKAINHKFSCAYAFYRLGEMHQNGMYFERNEETAYKYFKQALLKFEADDKKRPDMYLKYRIGYMYYHGFGTDVNYKKAEEYLREAEKLGNENVHYILGCLYTNRETDLYNLEKGIEYLEKAAEQENEYAQYKLGKLYLDPKQEMYDLEKGIKYLEKAAEQENEYAQYKLGKLYLDPEQKIYDLEKGIGYLEKAAEQGNEYAQYKLGSLYVDPDREMYDLDKGIGYLEKAAEQENEYAQYKLGSLYVDPDQKMYDLEKGIEYLKKAAEQGNAYAECKLGDVYVYQKNNIIDGMKWYKRASDKGSVYAKKQGIKMSIGMFKSSIQMRRNWEYEKAIRALKKSFEKDYKTWKNILEHDRELERRQEEQLS